jgi:hypothetical protein
MLPIVDVSDNSMAASGTTKRISINNILACSPSATLASATISGALDAARLNVTGATIPANGVYLGSANNLSFSAASTLAMTLNSTGLGVGGAPSDGRLLTIGSLSSVSATANAINIYSSKATLNITADGATNAAGTTISYSWANGGQGPLIFRNASIANVMTLDASGNVGVGVTPSQKLDVFSSTGCVARIRGGSGSGQSAAFYVSNTAGTSTLAAFGDGANMIGGTVDSSAMVYAGASIPLVFYVNSAERMRIDSSGNVGVGVTPSTVWTANGNLQVGVHAALYTNASLGATDFAYNSIRTGSDTYQYSFATSLAASRLQQRDGSFRFFTAPAGTSPNAITFTERLRLKETGQLRFVPLAADPAGAEAGDVYYNSSSNKLKCYNGTTWNDLF